MTLDEFIKSKIKEESKGRFEYLTITEDALRKAQRYARLVAEEFDDAECYGLLLAEADDERVIVTDCLLAPDQKVARDHADVSSEGILKAADEIRQSGKKCLGVWHSHGRFKPFHSQQDDDNHEVVLAQLAPANYMALEADDVLLEGQLSTVFKDGKLTIAGANGVLELALERGKLQEPIEVAQVKLTSKDYVGFAYSLVVTANSEKTYAEIMIKRFGAYSANNETARREVKLNLLSEEHEQLLEEIRAKVTREKWSWGWGRRDWDDDDEDERHYGRHKESSWYS